MDGTIITNRSRCVAACVCVVVAMLPGRPSGGGQPPLLPIDGVAIQPLPLKSQQQPIAADPDPPTLVRPPARTIQADQPTVLRPRPRVIDARRSPMIAVLSGTAETGSDVSPPPLIQPPARVGGSPARTAVTVEQALDAKGSVTFRKTPLSEVVFLLSDLWHINIVAGENVSGEVSGSFHNTPLKEVLTAALAATGYSYRQTGNSLVVLPVDQVGADSPDFVSQTLPLPAALQADESVLQAAELLLSERGRVQRLGESALLVVDTAPRIARVRQLFEELVPTGRGSAVTDNPVGMLPAAVTQSGIAYFTPQFTEAEEMAEPLQTALGETVVVAVYPEENRIMVKGTAEDLRLASEAIEQLDQPRPQVRITAMIYDVGLSELEEHGVNWTRDLRALANNSNDAFEDVTTSINELFAFTSDLTSTGATRIGLRTLTDALGAGVFLELLDATAEAKLLADPSVTVRDRQQASIRIVRRIPIVGANPIENSNAVFTQVEFEEAGVILNVQPRISRDGTIELQVQPEYSVVAEITSTGPVIDSRTAETTVRVGNGQMFVLGGLRQKSIVESVRGIPYLKDIKFVGKLFRSHDAEVRESELIVFLKPEIITPFDGGQLREQRAACIAKKQLDAIPYAETRPSTPDCKDPNCPNHHPRPRLNCGSRQLEMMGGIGINGYEMYVPQNVEIMDQTVEETIQASPQQHWTPQASNGSTPSVIEEVYPPVHIDPRAMNINADDRPAAVR